MARLLHRFGKGNATVGRLDEIDGSQSMRRKLTDLQPGQRHPPIDDIADGLRIECPLGDIAPTIDRPKHTAAADLRYGQPSIQSLHRPPGQVDPQVVAAAGRRQVAGDRLGALRKRCRRTARTSRGSADLRAGEAKAPSKPRHLVCVDHLASLRPTVAGTCGPIERRKPPSRNAPGPKNGGHEFQQQRSGAEQGSERLVGAKHQASR